MSNEPSPSQLVVIGSSAGGIEALAKLVSTIPTPFPAPILIAQHLDPSRPSHLGEILARRSPIPVVTVHQNERLLAGTVYVVPSNHNVEITDHDITLLPDGAGRPKPSIDLLLTTASQIYGEQLIAVILTGTGSDGAMGARAVKEAGGTIVVQNPDTAAFPGMPHAIEPQIVDIVANLPRIGPILFDLLTGVAVPPQAAAESELGPFLQQVHEYTGIDFSSYKTATILRRLQRRILAVGMSDLAAYKEYLAQYPDEYQRLASTFLIKVTDFMRDQALFDILREQVIPELIATSRKSGNELRLWSAGCATGQEAYSLAILIIEALGDELPNFSVKIFATDLDADAVAFARHGLYPPGTLAHMPEDLVACYFNRSEAGYEVKKLVRSLVVFGEHNLADRAPFPRIDMVLCRNVLIYFTRDLQQRALQLFAFSLREGGYLVLGKTETVSPASDFFAPELSELKIYRRHGNGRPTPPVQIHGHTLPLVTSISRSEERLESKTRRQSGQKGSGRELFLAQQESLQARLFKENLLFNLPTGVVVVDKQYDIREINNAARQMLGIHTVALGDDLLHLAHHIPPKAFRAAIDRAFRERTVTKLDEVQVPQMATGEPTYLRIECYPQPDVESQYGKVVGDDRADLEDGEGREEEGKDRHVSDVENVLILVTNVTETVESSREQEQGSTLLRVQTEELRVANQTLNASNEKTAQANIALGAAHSKAEELAARHARQVEELVAQNRKLVADHTEVRTRHVQQIAVLAEANRDLLAANREVTKANSELRVTLDGFLVTNEEAQAAVEEVETLNEEMQATNEELETLNEELQATIEELNTSNSDLAARGDELQNLALSLEIQKAQLEVILSGLTDAVLVVTEEGKPLLMNAAYTQLFGDVAGRQVSQRGGADANSTNEGASRGKAGALFTYDNRDGNGHITMLLDEHSRPLLLGETPQARAARGETFSMTFALASESGEERRYLEAVGQPVIADNEQKWGIVVIRDITERNLRLLQEQFTSLASHELRTPLTSIKGYLQMLDKSLRQQKGSERQINFVQIALTQTNRQMRLIEDLLDVARIQTGKFTLRCEPLRLDTLLEQVVETGQMLAKGQEIELTIDGSDNHSRAENESEAGDQDATDTRGSLLVNGDATRIEQALLNLLNNAITHAPGSARIDVRLCRVEGMVAGAGREVTTAMAEINVQDYGRGIPAKDLSYLFTRFYQVGQGSHLPTRGLGLGLFITRQIVEAHGGTVSVESVEGEGTNFIIRLPLLEEKGDLEK